MGVQDGGWIATALVLEEQRRKLQENLARSEALHMQQARDERLRRQRELEVWQRRDANKQLVANKTAKEESIKAKEQLAAQASTNLARVASSAPSSKKDEQVLGEL